MRNITVRTCFDRLVPAEHALRARVIALEENSANRSQTGFEASAVRSKLWKPGRLLRISFLDGAPKVQQKIEATAREWLRYANIQLEFGDYKDAEIRISFMFPGSWSAIGTDALVEKYFPADMPTMNFGWLTPDTPDSEYHVVLHEFGHALGLIHEHQSPSEGIKWNRQVVIEALSGPPNYWDYDTIERNMFQRYEATITQYTQFDPASIMLYSLPQEWTLNNHVFPENTTLSATDRSFIAKLYPF